MERKESSQITEGKRGQLQTVVMAANAAGDYIPPMIICKAKRMVLDLEKDFPPRKTVCCQKVDTFIKICF